MPANTYMNMNISKVGNLLNSTNAVRFGDDKHQSKHDLRSVKALVCKYKNLRNCKYTHS